MRFRDLIVISVPDYRPMAENAPKAPPESTRDVWHVDFHMSFESDTLTPFFSNFAVSHGIKSGDEVDWHHEGIATFEGPEVVIPRAGAELIPYLLYHLKSIKDFLVQEHVQRTFAGIPDVIGPDVGVPVQPAGTEPVYDS